jgi:putative endonuclease
VFAQNFPTALEAIAAEKKIKGWVRIKKVALIESMNPGWEEIPTF